MDGFVRQREESHKLDLIVARALAIWSRTEPKKLPTIKQIMQPQGARPPKEDTQANARAWIAVLKNMNKGRANE